jgi:hypothetical protein
MRNPKRSVAVAVACLGLLASACNQLTPDGTLRVAHSCSRASTVTVTIDGVTASQVERAPTVIFRWTRGATRSARGAGTATSGLPGWRRSRAAA